MTSFSEAQLLTLGDAVIAWPPMQNYGLITEPDAVQFVLQESTTAGVVVTLLPDGRGDVTMVGDLHPQERVWLSTFLLSLDQAWQEMGYKHVGVRRAAHAVHA